MRKQLSVPVSLMIIIIGFVLSYYIFHANGWSWNGTVALADIYRRLPIASRVLVVAGLVLNAWGFGSLLSALAGRRSVGPPS
jgi:hypothetical protein